MASIFSITQMTEHKVDCFHDLPLGSWFLTKPGMEMAVKENDDNISNFK